MTAQAGERKPGSLARAITYLKDVEQSGNEAFMFVRNHPTLTENEKHDLGNMISHSFNWTTLALRELERLHCTEGR